MGKLVVTIGVGDQQGRQFEDLEVTVDSLLWRRHRARQGQPVIGAILTHLRLRRL